MTHNFDYLQENSIDNKIMLNEDESAKLLEMEESGRYKPTAEEIFSAQSNYRESLRKKWIDELREQAVKELNMDFLASIAFNNVEAARNILEKKHDIYGEQVQVQIDIKDNHAFNVSAKSGNLEMLKMFAELQGENEKWPTWVSNVANFAYAGGHRDATIALLKDDKFGEYADIFSKPQMLLRESIINQDKELMTAIFSRIPNKNLSLYYDFITIDDENKLGDKKDSAIEMYYEVLADRKKTPSPSVLAPSVSL